MILLLDTSTGHLAIGMADEEGALLHEFHAEAGASERGIHDERLALETHHLLRKSGISPMELSRIGLVIGPGSFTGLRIGLSFAKGLAFATGAAISTVTQHEVLAAEIPNANVKAIVTPGYREDLFYISGISKPHSITLTNGESLGTGPFLAHEYFLTHPSIFVPNSSIFASPGLETLARLTILRASPLKGDSLDALEPLYITEFKLGTVPNLV